MSERARGSGDGFDRPTLAEATVLRLVARLENATAGEVRRLLNQRRSADVEHSTVGTLLKRLETKRLIVRSERRAGKAFIYSPSPHYDAVQREWIEELIVDVFDGDSAAMAIAALELRPPDAKQVARLAAFLGFHQDRAMGPDA
jgi:predicted transcriptional regulator